MPTLEIDRARGFTLVEVLVGLAVFSIGVLALFHLRGESARSIGALQSRALAQIVAENQIIETLDFGAPLVIGMREGETEMAGRDWHWSQQIVETTDANLRRVVVAVRMADEQTVLAELTAFKEVH